MLQAPQGSACLHIIHLVQGPEGCMQVHVHIYGWTHVCTFTCALDAELILASMPLLAFRQISGGNGDNFRWDFLLRPHPPRVEALPGIPELHRHIFPRKTGTFVAAGEDQQ